MTPAFGDTFYYLALLNPRDEGHERAKAVTRTLRRPIVTTAWVLTELLDAFAAPDRRLAVVGLVDDMRIDPEIEVVPPSADLFEGALLLYRQRTDKDWSLTDCVSFVVMTERGISDALTADHHFEQAGFVAMLK